MYSESFYGDQVLFGLAEIIYFVGAAINGQAFANVAPVLISIAQAHPKGTTQLGALSVLTSYESIAISGDSLAQSLGLLVTPFSPTTIRGDSSVSVPTGYLTFPAIAAARGDSAASSTQPVLVYNPTVSPLGDATVTVTPVLWSYPTIGVKGRATTASSAVLRIAPLAAAQGNSVFVGLADLVQPTTASIMGDSFLSTPAAMLRYPLTIPILGECTITAPPSVLRLTGVAPMNGHATTTLVPVLRDTRFVLSVGDSAASALGVVRSIASISITGDSAASSTSLLTHVQQGAIRGHATINPTTLIGYLLTNGTVRGDAYLNQPPFLLWNDTLTSILGSGGSVAYSTDAFGVLTAKFISVPFLHGEATVAVDSIGRSIIGASFFTLLDPSRTGVDGSGYAQIGLVVE